LDRQIGPIRTTCLPEHDLGVFDHDSRVRSGVSGNGKRGFGGGRAGDHRQEKACYRKWQRLSSIGHVNLSMVAKIA